MAYGQVGHLGVTRESSWGTPVAISSGNFIEAWSESLTWGIDRFEVKNIFASPAEPDDMAGVRRATGEIAHWGHPVSIGHLINGVMGHGSKAVTVVLSGFLWTIDWMPSPTAFSPINELPPYTIEIFRDVTSSFRFSGGQFGPVAFAVQPNQDLRVTAGVLAKTTSVIAKSTATYPGSPATPFAFDATSIAVAGAATDVYQSMTLTLDPQLEGIPTLNNTTEISRVHRRGGLMARLAGSLYFEDLTEYKNFVDQTEQRFVFAFTRANSFRLLFDLPRVVYTTFPVAMPGRESITVGFEGRAFRHAGSGTNIKITLTTTQSTY